MKFKKNNITFDEEIINHTAQTLSLPPKFIELLFSRGIDTEEKIQKYLYEEKNTFHDPFEFKNMRKVVERIRQAAQNNEKVVVCCDYDADGICAGAILSLFLASIGIEVYTKVPSRGGDGYGLSIESLDKIIEEVCPDLIITCDCGISCVDEVEHTLDLGVDIIVTDHHEAGDRIPCCLVINPKVPDCGYPCENLSGAGVALKLVAAYLGEDAAEEYLDMAAIATVADLVPLLDENRLLVQRGLRQIKKRSNLGLSRMMDRLQLESITATDIAFKIAPRINAAGRMGDASRAFSLLISNDIKEIDEILDQIERDNELRKELGENLYAEAILDLKYENMVNKRTIALSHPAWEKGITGIMAARVSGDFKRPAFIMVGAGNHFKGTARSIEGINVYEVLRYAGDLLVEFGGHSMAAGFSIKEENINAFKQRVEEYVNQVDGDGVKIFNKELFLPAASYDIDIIESDLTQKFVRVLELMEPFGSGNHRPLFLLKTKIKSLEPLKSNPVHTQIVTAGGLSLMAFGFMRKNQILAGGGEKDLIIEAQTGVGGGVRGLLRYARNNELYINDGLAKANFIKTLNFKDGKKAGIYAGATTETAELAAIGTSVKKTRNGNIIKYSKEELNGIIGDNIYGTLIIAGREESFKEFVESPLGQKAILKEFICSTCKNNYTRLIVSPDFDEDLPVCLYDKVVFLDSPLNANLTNYILGEGVKQIYVPFDDNSALFLKGIDLSREIFGKYYEALRRYPVSANTLYSYFSALCRLLPPDLQLDICQFVVCLSVFKELGLINLIQDKGFSVIINKGVKAELDNSIIYQEIRDR